MSSDLNSVHHSAQPGATPLGVYYTEVLRAKFATVWRHKLVVVTAVALALALGGAILLVTPKRYTAESLVHGGFTAQDLISGVRRNSGTSVGFDALQLVETQSRLLQSHQLARQVVDRIGLYGLQTEKESPFSGWLQAQLHGDALASSEYRKDQAAEELVRDLTVRTEPRVYLVAVSYSNTNPERAALVVNAFVAEFLRSVTMQKLVNQRASAKVALSQAQRTFGDKHPQVRHSRQRLAAADGMLKIESTKQVEEILQDAGDKVTPAQAPAVPSSPNSKLILLVSLLLGLSGGVGLALLLPAWRVPRTTHMRTL